MKKPFRGHFLGGGCDSKLLSPSLTTEVQTGKCYRATENNAFTVRVTLLYIFTDIQCSCRTQIVQ